MHEQIEFQFIEAKAGKSCHKCGEDIVGKAISQIYCSKECREEVWCKDSRCRANRRPVKGGKRKACLIAGRTLWGVPARFIAPISVTMLPRARPP